MKEEALKLADDLLDRLDAPRAIIRTQASAMIRRLVEELDKPHKYDPETGEPLIDGYPLFSGLPHPVKELTDRIAELEKQLDTRTRELIGASFYEHDYKTLMAKPPLTDKEIEEVAVINLGHSMGLLNWMGFARAIEERHGIK